MQHSSDNLPLLPGFSSVSDSVKHYIIPLGKKNIALLKMHKNQSEFSLTPPHSLLFKIGLCQKCISSCSASCLHSPPGYPQDIVAQRTPFSLASRHLTHGVSCLRHTRGWESQVCAQAQDFMVQMGTTMTRITVQAAAAIRAAILQTFALRNSASFRFNKES